MLAIPPNQIPTALTLHQRYSEQEIVRFIRNTEGCTVLCDKQQLDENDTQTTYAVGDVFETYVHQTVDTYTAIQGKMTVYKLV